jgi:hypothetical protein
VVSYLRHLPVLQTRVCCHSIICVCPLDVQDLSVYGMNLSSVPDTQLLTALTASSQLTQLVVLQHALGLSSDTVPLPRGALQQMFALPKQWPSLQASYFR